MSSNYAQESSGSGRQGIDTQAASGSGGRENANAAAGHRAVNTSDIDACERDNTHSGYGGHNIKCDKYGRDTSLDKYAQTMGDDQASRGPASGNISASIMDPSAGTGETAGSSSVTGAGHRGGNTQPATTGGNPTGIRPPQYRGRFSGQGGIGADASANEGTSYDESSHPPQMPQHGAPQDDFIGECHQPGCATCWSTGHYDVSLDPAAAAVGHRTIGHHTTDQHPIGHHVDTSAMAGGSWDTHTRSMRGGADKMTNIMGDAGMQAQGPEPEARAYQAPVQN